MIQGHSRSWSTFLAALIAASSLVACIQEAPKKAALNTEPDDRAAVEEPTSSTDTIEPAIVPDSGAFGKPTGNSSSGTVAAKKFCAGDLKAGDLAVTEIMISSKTGSGDAGEWVEIQNTHEDCWLKIGGVTVESPRGATADSAKVEAGYELAPNGTFLVAGSLDSTKNHGLPGKVFSWDATDVLKNDGDTITVKLGDLVIDKVTYPSLSPTAGTAMSFPVDCGDRSDWTKWAGASDTYGTTFKGTPNAVNDDVNCAK